MANNILTYLCSGLPLNPLPENKGRNPNIAHASIRVPNLNESERKVSRIHKFFSKLSDQILLLMDNSDKKLD